MDSHTLELGAGAEKKPQAELNLAPVEEESSASPEKGFFSRIRYYEELLDRKLGIESHSLDRVPADDRHPPNSLAMAFMWASATMNISCFSTGFLGKQFGLSLGQTIPIVICSTFLGACVTVSSSSDFSVFSLCLVYDCPVSICCLIRMAHLAIQSTVCSMLMQD